MKTVFFLGLAGVLVLAVIAGPLIVLWALNTLFPALQIPYDFWTWLSILILLMVIAPRVAIKK